MVPGSDGGMGSGVRIQFKQIINFDLICLYSNVKAERFLQRPKNARLVARSNKLLRSDANINEGNEHISIGHGLRTPNEGINQRYLKNWAKVADKICFGRN